MSESYTEVTGVKPTTISRDGNEVRLIFRTSNADLHLQFAREHLEGLIDELIALSEAAALNASLDPDRQRGMPDRLNVPATLRIDEATVAVGEKSVLIRWGRYDESGQVNIYGNAFEALRFAFSQAPSISQ